MTFSAIYGVTRLRFRAAQSFVASNVSSLFLQGQRIPLTAAVSSVGLQAIQRPVSQLSTILIIHGNR